ncbi:MAG: hypothetical protein ACTSRS_20545 [Candidatus Helarchaeota archaeon]
MSSERELLQEAINRAIKSANRALKRKAFGKVAEIYYRIASMLNDLGDDAGAQKFADAAKQFKERNQIIEQINEAIRTADIAYEKKDYATVAENYFKISSLSELIGDLETAKKFKQEAENYLATIKTQPQLGEPELASIKTMNPSFQSQMPINTELKNTFHLKEKSQPFDLGNAMIALGLVCPSCGAEINPELDTCPHCKNPI